MPPNRSSSALMISYPWRGFSSSSWRMTYLRSPCSNMRPPRNGPPRPRRPPPPNHPVKSGSKLQPLLPEPGVQPIQMLLFHIGDSGYDTSKIYRQVRYIAMPDLASDW